MVDSVSPDLIFLSEIQMYRYDLSYCMSYFQGKYCCELNSEDKHDVEIAMNKSKAIGGTMVLWKKALDKFITTVPATSPGFLPIIFSPPDSPPSVHLGIYLPTAGKEAEFLDIAIELSNCVAELTERFEDCLVFIRGDGNINPNNAARVRILSSLLSSHSLCQVKIMHKTYHHFMGGGTFDSNIDIILHSTHAQYPETVTKIFCKHDHPDMDSHHDAVLSTVFLPINQNNEPRQDLLTAPKLQHSRYKVVWSLDGIAAYQQEVSSMLAEARLTWLNPASKTSLAVLLFKTNEILSKTAQSTNRVIKLGEVKNIKSKKKPIEIKQTENTLREALRKVKLSVTVTEKEYAAKALKMARNNHRHIIKSLRNKMYVEHDQKFFEILSSNPSSVFTSIKRAKSSSKAQVPFIMVGEKKYKGDKAIDGLYESILHLKTSDQKQLASSPFHQPMMEDYKYIKLLCSTKSDLPPIPLKESNILLHRIKPSVSDFFSISAYHFIHAGLAGMIHYNLLLNSFITDVNNCDIKELNTVLALLLYKGHNKDMTLDTSYRTISTCPLLAKSLDLYVRDLFISKWNSCQAKTQYQGESSSHELASLLVTEAVQYSKYERKLPIFLLFLDARSAFDRVVTPYLVRNLYLSGMVGNSLLYTDIRLSNRVTYCQFQSCVAGPIRDELGVEQGGVSSSDLYKVYNNELLDTANQSELGVDFGNSLVVSAIGQADDTALISNDISKLFHILQLVLTYCQKYNVQLSTSKTKLLMIPPARNPYFVLNNPIQIDGQIIEFTDQAEHVGVVRSSQGNLPAFFND